MKKKSSWLLIQLLLFLINPLMSQYVVSQKGNKVEVHDLKGKFIASGTYPHLKNIAQGDDIVLLWYESDKVEARSYTLKYIASQKYSNIKDVRTSKDNVVLYYKNGKIEIRDKNLKYISSLNP